MFFKIIIILLLIITYFQGFIDKLKMVFPFLPPNSVWGPLKYSLLIIMLGIYSIRILRKKRLYLNPGMRIWVASWIITWIVFGFLIIEALNADSSYNPIGAIQNFGIGNMFLGVMVYLDCQQKQVKVFLKILVVSGICAAIFGVIQRLVGPPLFAAIGIDLFDPNIFAFLSSNNMETQHLDVENGFRAFSFFASHHAFSAFLILSTISLQMLLYQNSISKKLYQWAMIVLFCGFIVTFNLTNLISCLIILYIFAAFQKTNRIKMFKRFVIKKNVLKNAVLIFLLCICAISFIEPLRNRILGIFDISASNAGAGGSVHARIDFITNELECLSQDPLGQGLILVKINDPNSNLSGFSRRNYLADHKLRYSGDAWFLWLLIQTGIPFGILYFSLFFIPIYYGWKYKNIIINKDLRIMLHGITALLIIVFIGGISNSPILVFPPSNLFIWAAVGLLFKIPTWDKELQKQNVIANSNLIVALGNNNENRI